MSRLLRMSAIAGAILLVGTGAGYGIHTSGQKLAIFEPAPDPTAIARLDFESDGVLDSAWFAQHFPIASGTPALGFDVHALKMKVERFGQVARASVSITLPDTLVVRVQEHVPVLRARVQVPGGAIKTVLIAAGGEVYEGFQYPPARLRSLPGLVGVRFRQAEGRFLPVELMKTVAPLLHEARHDFPELYARWEWISLQDMPADPSAPNAIISVRSRDIDTIVFAPRVYYRQLRKLSEVVALAEDQDIRSFRRIDLSIPDQAIVQVHES